MAKNSMRDQLLAEILSMKIIGTRLLTVATILALTACVPSRSTPAPIVTPPPATEVYFYPTKDQNEAQQNRDRYECYLWAKKQTGFDPSAPQLAPHLRVTVEPIPPSGDAVAAGAITGAVIGSAVSKRGKKSEGAAIGAMAGAIIGAASEAERSERAKQQLEQGEAQRAATIEQQASNYRRAMAACLKGRGYEVR